ncbi:hypothetical protein BGZ96_003914 [Linnemannia gamsii]|uniref:Uncharacterized protein n=1 Tax=Linnemannia gamsii TaxID=64522 RepID=A0ABQ7KEY7_9FUNG|nr:hypothetical protein BGZ96_003914 [Linnemannia gamsii]
MSLFSPAVDNGSGGQVRQDSRSEQDREVFEVCSRRLQCGYTPSQNIHKALVSSIRSSFLASLNGSQRASLMLNSSDSPSIVQQQQRQQQQPTSAEDGGDLQDFQQPWYQPQHLPYHASPDQEYDVSTRRSFEREEGARRHREEELLESVAQLEKELYELRNSTVELQASLCESEERNERLVIEHDSALRRVKEEHDHQIQDTKKRTKRFYDETMRKRQRDEDKRLEGLQEQLVQAQAANKDLRSTIRGLQRERVDAEQAQRDDLSVLCLFIENVLSPMVFGLGTGGGVTQLQAVGTFKHHRRPSTINTVTANATIAKSNPYDHDLTPTTAVPRPIPLFTPSSQDTPKSTVTTTTTGQCTSPRGQKCMSLLEQFQSALSISFVNTTTPTSTTLTSAVTTAVTTPTTPHNPDKAVSSTPQAAGGGLQHEKSPKTPAPFRKTHARHSSTAIAPNIATAAKHGRHDPLTEEHLTRMHDTERLEYLNSQRARKRYSDSSTTSSGHTFVAPLPPSLSYQPGALKAVSTLTTNTPGTPAIIPRYPASEKQTVSNPDSATATAISSPQKQAPVIVPPSSKTNDIADIGVKEKDRSLQQCLVEQHTRYQKEIERIKQQCIKIYRQSLEDVRADVRFKIGQRGGGGGGGGRDQRRRASSTISTVPVPVVATATAH